jgi:hypothetical protein
MDKNRVGNRFRVPLTKVGELNSLGTIFRPSILNDKSQELTKMNRVLKTAATTDVQYGDVIVGKSGATYICADNGSGEVEGYDYKTFRLFLVEASWKWERPVRTLDPITQLERGTTFTDLGNLYISLEPIGVALEANVRETQFQAICNQAPQLGDRINEKYTVKRLEQRLGVWVAILV